MKGVIAVTLIVVVICFIWPSNDVWKGYFYPDATNLSNSIETGEFDTLEECRDVTLSYAEDMGIPYGQYDYECGLNCEIRDYGLNICEETLQ